MRTAAAGLLLAACGGFLGPDGPDDRAVKDCAGACEHLRELGCEEGDPTPGPDGEAGTADDGTCEAVCENAAAEGIDLDPTCVGAIKECSQIDDCAGEP